jgi:hypothetical protein
MAGTFFNDFEKIVNSEPGTRNSEFVRSSYENFGCDFLNTADNRRGFGNGLPEGRRREWKQTLCPMQR